MTTRAARALLSVLAVCGAPVVGGCGGHQATGGPLVAPNGHGWAMSQPVGFEFTDGMETLHLNGNRSATLRKVELVGSDGLELLGVALVKPGRDVGTVQEIDGWPARDRHINPSDVVSPGIGATFTPARGNPLGQSYELLVGMKVVRAGYLVRDGLRITYAVNGTSYTRYFPAQLTVCTSARFEKHGSCPFPDG